MRKTLSIIVSLMLLLPTIAFADGVLSDGWEAAPFDSLIEAKNLVSRQITQLLVHQEVPAEGFSLSGEGLSITDGYTLPAGIWRRSIVIPNAKSFEDKVTLTKGGKNDTISITDATMVTPIQVSGGIDVDYAVIETAGSWSITYTPIAAEGTIDAEGDGGFVGDFFVCSKPTIVTISAKSGYSSLTNFQVYLYTLNTSGRLSSEYGAELMVNELMSSGDAETFQAIIKPEDNVAAYLWVVSTDDGVVWSITAK